MNRKRRARRSFAIQNPQSKIKNLRIAYLGDIVGTPGRQALTQQVRTLRDTHGADLIIANAENIANGSGITPEQYKKLSAAGVDGMTLGDHAFRKQQIKNTLNEADNLIRPINLPGRAWGKGWMRIASPTENGPEVVVVMIMCRLFMNSVQADDPFAALDRFLDALSKRGGEPPIVIAEIHGEATSEKVAFGWHANGRVAAVVGSHTHVPTADARVLPAPGSDLSLPGTPAAASGGGTAYVTDLGMTGPQDSVLGRRVDRVVKHMSTGLPAAFDVAEGHPVVQGVLIDIDETSRRATRVERIALPADVAQPPFAAR
ncbi:MAG: TIGR00282 family metallophosphoesterase [Planctomycetota bacterium]